ncbi:MAG: aldo/keto reductase [Reyranella sp.]|uniref:aldo/keto reductase n=1 Tax=Reyranella sp. TaxID=1929291 RepID=UPI0012241859|nr:aldo/keto reductase [Reyranella sp.]TAJ37794.1 MAG: aldo/keto reductase [Reyranella sp.]
MDYRPLGNTGLSVSVAGLGCGGNSRLGLGRGASVEDCVAVVRTAIDLGVNFLDTAEAYGTEEIVGAAARFYDRDRLVISTKAIFRGGDETAPSVTAKVEASLKRLGLDYVDIFHFHAVGPDSYEHHRDVLAPALLRLKEKGKVRHVGITETGPRDPEQKMLARAVEEGPWEVIMLAYSLMNQGARRKIFPVTLKRGIGTLLMFVVRNIFSNDAYRRDVFAKLVEQGLLDASILASGDPLAFLVAEGGAKSITDAAYRYARHEQGADVILFGTGDRDHVRANVESILRPPLAPAIVERLHASFGHLSGVGLDLPGPVKGA